VTCYYENVKTYECNFENDKKNGLELYYKNDFGISKCYQESQYVDGEIVTMKRWFRNGNVNVVKRFIDGFIKDEHIYYEDGGVKEINMFNRGVITETAFYTKDGMIDGVMKYVDGVYVPSDRANKKNRWY
jgi:antitoxin component YwqK of YwqJK toxin-antitoxin module